jgi:cyclophilin family peptidyl-prolyl cis-trans isomerase
VSREQFEEGLELVVGGTVYDAYGRPYVIVEINESTVTLDGNHRLAGKELTFEIELLGIVQKRTYSSAPSMVINTSKEYVATIETEKGNLVLELYADEAPITVNNFVFLARDGFFDGTTFYRVTPDFMAQAGDPTGTSSYSPGYTIPYEDSGYTHVEGALSMANTGDPNSGSCHFFITYVAKHDLDGGHTVFGQLVEGMDVLEGLTARDPSTGPSYPGDTIVRVTVEEM